MPGLVLITNNSDVHPPETWAAATASMILAVESVEGTSRVAALSLQSRLAQTLLPHHRRVQQDEARKLSADPHHHASPHVQDPVHVMAVVDALCAEAVGTPWEADFADNDFRQQLTRLLHHHFTTAREVHRAAHRHSRRSQSGE